MGSYLCQPPSTHDQQAQTLHSDSVVRQNEVNTQTLASKMIQYIFDLPILGAEMLWCIWRFWQTWCSHGTLYSELHRKDEFPANSSCSLCRSHLPPASPRSAEGFVCVSASLATVPLGCAGPRRHRWLAAVCDRPSHPAMITFSSPPNLFPAFAALRGYTSPPPLLPPRGGGWHIWLSVC